jgi:alkylation response protein AidB-like acyl-CoA dehydrogenase
MDLRDSPNQARFRQAVGSWLRENLPEGWDTPAWPHPETQGARVAFARAWQRKLCDGGWAGVDWPAEYGGRGVGPVEHVIYQEEYARARAPDLITLSVGTSLVGPVLIAHGSPEQRTRHLPAILRGDELWCQGFSEPNAGSDLAGLRTRGDVQGDEIVVTGQKIWTSFAQDADWCILVVRTDPDSVRQRGLTFLLVDMTSPGITVRPLREMTGEAWFNEVFFDAVRVPAKHVVGAIDRGWDVVVTTLYHERGSSSQHARLAAELERLVALARVTPRGAATAAEDPLLRQKLARFATEISILRITAYRDASRVEYTGSPGPEGSILKLLWSDLEQRVKETAIEILGAPGLVPAGDARAVDAGHWCHELLWSRAATIYAGTSEIQRNIVAQRVLGLPRA